MAIGTTAGALVAVVVGTAASRPTAAQALQRAVPDATHNVIVSGQSQADGYHLYVADQARGWQWRPLATLDPGGTSEDTWLGQHCVTGDGQYAVVVVERQHEVNDPVAFDRGAVAYEVNLATAQTTALVSGTSFAYFNPGCGASDDFALTAFEGRDEQTTVVQWGRASVGITATATLPAEVTSAIPTSSGAVAALGNQLVAVRKNLSSLPILAKAPGRIFDLHPTAAGGVDFLTTSGSDATAWRYDSGGLSQVGHGSLQGSALLGGYLGSVTLVNVTSDDPAVPSIAAPENVSPNVSSAGDVLAVAGPASTTDSAGGGKSMAGVSAPLDEPAELRNVVAGQVLATRFPSTLAPRVTWSTAAAPAASTAQAQTPTCAVPRLDPFVQVPQPSGAQIDWALQESSRNLLSGSNSRASGAFNLGLPAYGANGDFNEPALTGGSSSVPPQVMEGIFATESNWDQASFHAPRGMPGDPLVANYYGTDATLGVIDYAKADCGYGVGQVTSLMTTSSSEPLPLQTKIAVDYEENVAASEQILANVWNQLAGQGITMNDANPGTLEDWYMAIWAYNTPIHPNDGAGDYGLGWSDNPSNPTYPPNRPEFLATCSCDATHPSSWPYQERVMGFMDTPYSEGGTAFYASATPAGQYLSIPNPQLFCDSSDSCTWSASNGDGTCAAPNSDCWWHVHVSATNCAVAGTCHAEFFNVATTATEPTISDPEPPTCGLDSTVPSWADVVDDQPTNANLVGCAQNPVWDSPGGSFTVQYGTDPAGDPTGAIDWHQLGAGFGGHMWFTHTVASSDTEHIDTATWAPSLTSSSSFSPGEQYDIKVFIPNIGALDNCAPYEVYQSGSTSSPIQSLVNQDAYNNQWVDLGTYTLYSGASVQLSNGHSQCGGSQPANLDIGYDAIAFIPEDLSYYGGQVEAPYTHVYAIFWNPTGSYQETSYSSTINTYLQAAGQMPPFKNVLPQYYMTVNGQNTNIQAGQQQWLGAWTDTLSPYPLTGGDSCGPACISDSGIDSEVQRAIANNPSWEHTKADVYVVYPAQGWNVCGPTILTYQTTGCSGTGLCAYHSVDLGQSLYYAAVPYPNPADNNCFKSIAVHQDVPAGTVDNSIFYTAHEYAEMITDPGVQGWCGASGRVLGWCGGDTEVADKCEKLDPFNEVDAVNDHYALPWLWDNANHRCSH